MSFTVHTVGTIIICNGLAVNVINILAIIFVKFKEGLIPLIRQFNHVESELFITRVSVLYPTHKFTYISNFFHIISKQN